MSSAQEAASAAASPSTGEHADVRHAWSDSDRFVPRVFVRPAQQFMRVEAASAIVMLLSAVLALVWANSPWATTYEQVWTAPVELAVGPLDHLSGLSVREWINDGAMTLFFLLVAMEIKRELVSGDLRDPRAAALPVIAALGGMLVPAAIYYALNAGTATAGGWGVPMATDIAFAVAVVSLLGRRVPSGAKLLLLTLAIADDLGAIVVIAIFYTDALSVGWLLLGLGSVAVALGLRHLDVRSTVPFVTLGLACWSCLHESGVHTTLAGVAFGFLAPTWSFYDPARFGARVRPLVDSIGAAFDDHRFAVGEYERAQEALRDIRRLAWETSAPLDRLTHALAPWVSFVVVPVFALANAGVSLSQGALVGWSSNDVLLGVAAGLVVGETAGVYSAVWLTCRLTSISLPDGTTWRHVLGLSACAGIGFTVALFITELSSTDPEVVQAAKTGVLVGSIAAGLLGYAVLRTCPTSDGPAG